MSKIKHSKIPWQHSVTAITDTKKTIAIFYGKKARANAEFATKACNNYDALVKIAELAVAYDNEIKKCANDPDKMASHCTAQGKSLDELYLEWMILSRKALRELGEL